MACVATCAAIAFPISTIVRKPTASKICKTGTVCILSIVYNTPVNANVANMTVLLKSPTPAMKHLNVPWVVFPPSMVNMPVIQVEEFAHNRLQPTLLWKPPKAAALVSPKFRLAITVPVLIGATV